MDYGISKWTNSMSSHSLFAVILLLHNTSESNCLFVNYIVVLKSLRDLLGVFLDCIVFLLVATKQNVKLAKISGGTKQLVPIWSIPLFQIWPILQYKQYYTRNTSHTNNFLLRKDQLPFSASKEKSFYHK